MSRLSTLLALTASAVGLAACTVDGGTDLVDLEDWEGDPALLQCPDREPAVRAAIVALLDELRAGTRRDVTSVDRLLAALPAEVRENIIFFTETRSMAKIYPLVERRRMAFAPIDSGAYTFNRQDGRWCSTAAGATHCAESRVLFTSREADFVGSFTTDPESPSRDRFELILFDPTSSAMTMAEVEFEGGTPRVTMNPDSCKLCHEGRDRTINWRFDPYRFWAYATPFQEDFLQNGAIETEWYLAFLDRIAAGEDKLGQLRPFNPRQTVRDALAAQGSYQLDARPAAVDFAGDDSPSLNFSHQLLEKNGCRAAVQMAHRGDFDRVKYAAVGGLIGCDNVNDFFPTSGSYTRANAERYFTSQREGLAGGAFDLPTFVAETKRRQAALLSDKLSRRFDHLAEFVGEGRAMEDIRRALAGGPVAPGYGVTNFEKDDYGSRIALTRFLLEPLGVDVTQWSMSVDRVHQSHVEFMHPIVLQPVFIEMLTREFGAELGRTFTPYECQDLDTSGPQGRAGACYGALETARPRLCPKLAEKSRAALVDHPGEQESAAFASYQVEDLAAIESEARARASSSSLDQLTGEARGVYAMCAGCHEFGYEGAGFPWLPFQDMNELAAMFRRQRDAALHQMDGDSVGIQRGFGRPHMFTYTSLADRIWDRVNRHPRQHSFMPRNKIPLTRNQKVVMRAHMLKVLETEAP
jgi:hypothetical protein